MGVSSILDLGQKESGIYKILDKANVYLMVQAIFGGEKSRQSFVEQNISLSPGMNVLDVGSGTSDIVDHLPNCNYFAFEPALKYHLRAVERFGSKGTFFNRFFDKESSLSLPKFDLVLLQGVMHHMNDEELIRNLLLIRDSMSVGGMLVTIDPVFHDGQNVISKTLVSLDRGDFVRNDDQYRECLSTIFKNTQGRVQTKLFVPYSHFISVSTL